MSVAGIAERKADAMRMQKDGPQWVCVQSDTKQTLIGSCGDDQPSVCIPSINASGLSCMERGSVRDWDALRSLWGRGLRHLGIHVQNPQSITTTVPIFSTRKNITTLVTLMFQQLKAPAIFLTNPWIATLMSNGASTALVVHAEHDAACVVPVVHMRVCEQGMFRLPFGSADLKNPQIMEVLFKTVFQSILRSNEKDRVELCSRILLSGQFPENFESSLEIALNSLCDQCSDFDQLGIEIVVDAATEPKYSTWIGLSIIGSLSESVHEKPVIEEGAIGAYMTIEQYKTHGSEFIFADAVSVSALCPVGQGVGTIVSDAEIERPPKDPVWDSDDQFICVHTDASMTVAGRCGDDEPAVLIPTELRAWPVQTIETGAIRDWESVQATWKMVTEYLGMENAQDHGMVLSLPIRSTRPQVERMVDIAFNHFKVPSVFVTNPWTAALMASGCESGLVIHSENTATCIVPIIGMRTIEDALVRLPIGDAEYYDHHVANQIYKTVHDCILKTDSEHWETLWSHIIVSGGCAGQEDFVEKLVDAVQTMALQDENVMAKGIAPQVSIEFVAEAQASVWVGLSIIGALTMSLNKTPMIEDTPVGAFITQEEFKQHGARFVFSDYCDGIVITQERRTSLEKLVLQNTMQLRGSRTSLLTTASVQAGPIEVHQGWLMKQGGGTKTILSRKNWKNRWFILQGNQLTYHKSNLFIVSHPPAEVRRHATGVINLLDAIAIDPWQGKKHGFVIITSDRTYYINASSVEEQCTWIKKLRAAKDAVKSSTSVSQTAKSISSGSHSQHGGASGASVERTDSPAPGAAEPAQPEAATPRPSTSNAGRVSPAMSTEGGPRSATLTKQAVSAAASQAARGHAADGSAQPSPRRQSRTFSNARRPSASASRLKRISHDQHNVKSSLV